MLGSSTDNIVQNVKTFSNVIAFAVFQDGAKPVSTTLESLMDDVLAFDRQGPIEQFDWTIALLSGSLSAYAGPGTAYSLSLAIDFYHLE